MKSLAIKNLVLSVGMVIFWTGLTIVQARAGHPAFVSFVFVLTVMALSVAFWRINVPLVERFSSPEGRMTALATIAALLTVTVIILGAWVSAQFKAMGL